MNKTRMILVLFFAFVSCTLSSYLDIPPPPERPLRFKTKEQIENYLKAVKDYYDAFKIKLVRRDHSISDLDTTTNDQLDLLKKIYQIYQQNHPSRNLFRQQQKNNLIQ
jgi:hypothetical protein